MEQGFNTFGEEISEDNLYNMLGKLNKDDIETLLEAIQTQDTTAVLDLAKITFSKGIQPKDFLVSLSEFFRNVFHIKYLSKESNPKELSTSLEEMTIRANEYFTSQQLIRILDLLDEVNIEIQRTTSHQLKLELFLMKLVKPELGTDSKTVAYRVDLLEGQLNSKEVSVNSPPKEKKNKVEKPQKEEKKNKVEKPQKEEKKNKVEKNSETKGGLRDFDVHWPKILSEAKEVLSAKKFAYLTSVVPQVEKNTIVFQVPDESEFLLNQINTDNELIELIKSLVAKRLGIKIQVRAEIASGLTNGPVEDTVKLAQEMFNAEEVN
jgi:DNA polymerase-3 subunit gamma/tau